MGAEYYPEEVYKELVKSGDIGVDYKGLSAKIAKLKLVTMGADFDEYGIYRPSVYPPDRILRIPDEVTAITCKIFDDIEGLIGGGRAAKLVGGKNIKYVVGYYNSIYQLGCMIDTVNEVEPYSENFLRLIIDYITHKNVGTGRTILTIRSELLTEDVACAVCAGYPWVAGSIEINADKKMLGSLFVGHTEKAVEQYLKSKACNPKILDKVSRGLSESRISEKHLRMLDKAVEMFKRLGMHITIYREHDFSAIYTVYEHNDFIKKDRVLNSIIQMIDDEWVQAVELSMRRILTDDDCIRLTEALINFDSNALMQLRSLGFISGAVGIRLNDGSIQYKSIGMQICIMGERLYATIIDVSNEDSLNETDTVIIDRERQESSLKDIFRRYSIKQNTESEIYDLGYIENAIAEYIGS